MTSEASAERPRARKRTWVLLGTFAVIVVAVLWSALGGPGVGGGPVSVPPPPIPDRNGYDDVLEAGRKIEQSGLVGPKLDLAKADVAELEPVVEGSREAIAEARKGLEKSFQVPVVYEMNGLIKVTMRDLGSIRAGLVRGMVAQGRLAELQGRVEEAAGCYTDLIRLGEAMSHRVPMIAFQASQAVENNGLYHLRDMRGKLSSDQCRKLIGVLEEIDRTGEPAANVIKYETSFMNANMKQMGFFASIMLRVTGVQAKTAGQVKSSVNYSTQRQDAARRVLLADLALRLYRQEHGEAPPDLNALVPGILQSVPIDPYTGQPLRYQKRGKATHRNHCRRFHDRFFLKSVRRREPGLTEFCIAGRMPIDSVASINEVASGGERFERSRLTSNRERLVRRMLFVMGWISAAACAHAQPSDRAEPSIPALLSKIEGGNPDARENTAHALARRRVRAGAAQTLELIGPVARPAVDALRKCLEDRDAGVRAAAQDVIEQILKATPKVARSPTTTIERWPRKQPPLRNLA
jgi:hypothetical protein